MKAFSVIAVLLAVGLRATLAQQSGYNYDRPEGGRPQGPGFAGTTPAYAAPAFPNQATAPGGGYNYPSQSDTDFPTAAVPTGGGGYPTGPQLTGRPQGFTPSATGSGTPYPSAQGQQGIGSPYPAAGQPQPGNLGGQVGFAPSSPAAVGGVQANRPPQTFGGPSAGGIGSGGAIGAGAVPGVVGQRQDENQEGDYSAIPGEPEIDYPILSEIPETSFDCAQQEYPGYYADVEARCQVFHVCAFNNTRKYDFLCPNGTIFSQEFLVCVWWNQFDCNSAPGLFANNANLYETPNQQGSQQGVAAQPGAGIASDFPSAVGVGPSGIGGAGNYPAPGRPNIPSSFGQGQGTPATNYGPPPASSSGNGGFSSIGTTGAAGNYPSGPSQAQGPYPSGGGAPSNIPATNYQPPQQGPYPSQADTPYPPSGSQGTTPPRDYLPPRRG